MFMADKIPLIKANPIWERSQLGTVTCSACRWHGDFYALLCEPDSRRLYCPKCISMKWTYAKDQVKA